MLLLLILVGVCVPTCKRLKQKQVSFFISINRKGGWVLQQQQMEADLKEHEKRMIFLLFFGSNKPREWHKLSSICLPRGHANARGKSPIAQPRGTHHGYSFESPWLSCPGMNQSIWTCNPADPRHHRYYSLLERNIVSNSFLFSCSNKPESKCLKIINLLCLWLSALPIKICHLLIIQLKLYLNWLPVKSNKPCRPTEIQK